VRLDPGAVHVWHADLRAAAAAWPELAASLSDDERHRARRFVREEDRRRFVTARGLLRSLVGELLGIGARELQFSYGPHGKPEVAGHALRFNLSHSGDVALYAVAVDREVGVDIERTSGSRDVLLVARRFFAPAEARRLQDAAGPERRRLFARLWTMKEACLKAEGAGLFRPLRSVVPRVRPGSRSAWIDGRWHVRALRPVRGYTAAVAAEGDGWTIHRHGWSATGSDRPSAVSTR
jgi:4'-phosphopantetheinyl transferase